MRRILLMLIAGLALSLTSCRHDFEFEDSTGDLQFSKDTVYLDTVFTNIGSSTYTLKVYNRSNNDIVIPSIKLGQGEQSKYRLMVDGIPGKVFSNVELLAKDSMFVFIETTIDYDEYANNETTFLYTDRIEFDNGPNLQKVELVTLVQDAIFIKPTIHLPENVKEKLVINGVQSGTKGHELQTPEELHWTNEKPYVVYGYALVPNGKTMTVDPGARVHFHAESGLIVDNTGTLNINGASSTDPVAIENEVIFEGDRLEPDFSDIAGQWGTVLLFSGSNNTINHLTIKNAVVGLMLDRSTEDVATTPNVTISNSQIYNSYAVGLLGRGAVVNGDNLVINNSGEASLACTRGGVYRFRHCTFGNYASSYNQKPVYVADYYDNQEDGIRYIAPMDARFDNCILYGSSNYGIIFDRVGADASPPPAFNIVLNTCLIKFSDFSSQFANNAFYKFADSAPSDNVYYDNCIIARNSSENNPKFFDPQRNDLNILQGESAAENLADPAIAALVPFDIANISRASSPDIGAYESRPAPED